MDKIFVVRDERAKSESKPTNDRYKTKNQKKKADEKRPRYVFVLSQSVFGLAWIETMKEFFSVNCFWRFIWWFNWLPLEGNCNEQVPSCVSIFKLNRLLGIRKRLRESSPIIKRSSTNQTNAGKFRAGEFVPNQRNVLIGKSTQSELIFCCRVRSWNISDWRLSNKRILLVCTLRIILRDFCYSRFQEFLRK